MTKAIGISEQTLWYEDSMKPEGDLHFFIILFPLLGNSCEKKKVLYFPQNILLEFQELSTPMQKETMSDFMVLQLSSCRLPSAKQTLQVTQSLRATH